MFEYEFRFHLANYFYGFSQLWDSSKYW